MVIEIYAAESALLRVEKIINLYGVETAGVKTEIAKVYLSDATDRIWKSGKDALNSFVEGEDLQMALAALKRFTKQKPFNIKQARQHIALYLIEKNCYAF